MLFRSNHFNTTNVFCVITLTEKLDSLKASNYFECLIKADKRGK